MQPLRAEAKAQERMEAKESFMRQLVAAIGLDSNFDDLGLPTDILWHLHQWQERWRQNPSARVSATPTVVQSDFVLEREIALRVKLWPFDGRETITAEDGTIIIEAAGLDEAIAKLATACRARWRELGWPESLHPYDRAQLERDVGWFIRRWHHPDSYETIAASAGVTPDAVKKGVQRISRLLGIRLRRRCIG